MVDSKKAVIQTLLYSSLFDSPLTFEELRYFLHSDKKISHDELASALRSLKSSIVHKNDLYTLRGYESSFITSHERASISEAKIKQAERVIKLLAILPTVLFIGISGSVGVGNAKKTDDIDLFVITTKNSLYITRFFLLLLLQLFGRRRKRSDTTATDKLCLNMLIDESQLAFSKEYQDLYTAREIVQLYPLFARGDIYDRFLESNSWTRAMLPHALGRKIKIRRSLNSSYIFFAYFEPLAKRFEKYLIKRHQAKERVEDHLLALHPNDVRNNILLMYEKQLVQLKKTISR